MMKDTYRESTGDTASGTAKLHMMEDEFKEHLSHHQEMLRTIYEDNMSSLDAAQIATKHRYNVNTTYHDLQRIKKFAAEFFDQN